MKIKKYNHVSWNYEWAQHGNLMSKYKMVTLRHCKRINFYL